VILDAARQVLAEEGLPAISTRRVARQAGVNQALVHYHFKSIEQLLLEVLLNTRDLVTDSLSDVFEGDGSLVAKWRAYATRNAGDDYPVDLPSLWLQTVTMAASNPSLAEAYRQMYFEPVHKVILEAVEQAVGGPPANARAEAITALIMAVQRSVLIDRTLGATGSHEELFALVEDLIAKSVKEAKAAGKQTGAPRRRRGPQQPSASRTEDRPAC
jgi:AcrR family transcriptional regulator